MTTVRCNGWCTASQEKTHGGWIGLGKFRCFSQVNVGESSGEEERDTAFCLSHLAHMAARERMLAHQALLPGLHAKEAPKTPGSLTWGDEVWYLDTHPDTWAGGQGRVRVGVLVGRIWHVRSSTVEEYMIRQSSLAYPTYEG